MYLTDDLIYWLSLATVIVAASVAALLLRYWLVTYMRTDDWGAVIGVIVPLAVTWFLYHVGGFLYLLPSTRDYGWSYGEAAPEITAFLSILVLVGFVLYKLSFETVGRMIIRGVHRTDKQTLSAAKLSVGVLLPVDWYARMLSLKSGTYLTWVTQHFERAHLAATTDPLHILSMTTGYAIVGILCFLYWRSEHKGERSLAGALLSLQGLLLLMRGSRRDVFFLILLVSLGYVMSHRKVQLTLKSGMVSAVLGAILFGLMAGVAEARKDVRAQAVRGGAQPEQLMMQYIKKMSSSMISPRSYVSLTEDLVGRIVSYPRFTSVVFGAQVENRTRPAGLEALGASVRMAIPGFMYPDKPKWSPNEALWRHNQGVLSAGVDYHSTPIGASIIYLGVVGILVLFPIGGGVVGVYRVLLQRYGALGCFVMLGSIPEILLIGSDLGTYVSSLRNVGVIVGLIVVAFAINKGRERGARKVTKRR